jgi:hypothetical protein
MNTVHAWLSLESSERAQYVRHLETLLEESSDPEGRRNLENELGRIASGADSIQTMFAGESIADVVKHGE